MSNQNRPPLDGFIGRPHWSDHGDGQWFHQDQWQNGQKIDHFAPTHPLGAFAVGGAIEAARREAMGRG